MSLQAVLLLVLVVHIIIEVSCAETDDAYYISFVSLPLLGHVNPLKAIAEEMIHRGYRASLALPSTESEWTDEVQGLEFISTGPAPVIADELLAGRNMMRAGADVYESVHQAMLVFAEYQRAMYKELLAKYSADRPDLLVIDRFSFAGYDVAHALNLSYVVNNPTLLLDLDEPPGYIPAPYSGFALESQTIWERCLNPYYRLRFRLMMIGAFRTINSIRAENDLPAITNRWQLYGGRLILTNTASGVEYSRPMAPLFQMVGPLLPQKPEALRSSLLAWMESDDTGGSSVGTILVNLGQRSPLLAWQAEKLVQGLSAAKTANGEQVRILWVLPQEQRDVLPAR